MSMVRPEPGRGQDDPNRRLGYCKYSYCSGGRVAISGGKAEGRMQIAVGANPGQRHPKPHQCDIKATSKRVDSQAIGTPLRPQSHPNATPMRPQCDPNATPM